MKYGYNQNRIWKGRILFLSSKFCILGNFIWYEKLLNFKFSPSVLHVKHSSSQSIFIILILSLMVHIPIQNCLGTILFWLNYKFISIGRLFGYTCYEIPHVSNIWFVFHPHFTTTKMAMPALSDLLTVIVTI